MLFDPPLQIPKPVRMLSHTDHHPVEHQQQGAHARSPPPVSRSEPVDELRSILFHKPAMPTLRRYESRDWTAAAPVVPGPQDDRAEEEKGKEYGEEAEAEAEEKMEDEVIVEEEEMMFQPPTFSFDLPQCSPSLSPGPPDRCGNPITRNKGFLTDFNGALGARVQPRGDVHGAELGLLDLSPPRTFALHRALRA